MREGADSTPVSRAHIRTSVCVHCKKDYVGEMPSSPGKLRKGETFERWDVFALDLPAAGTQACAHTGLQHRHSGRLSSSSLLSVNLGYHLDRQPFGMKSRISAARCRVAGTRQRPRGTPAAEAPGERELAHTEVYPLPIARNSRCKLNLLGLPLKTQSFLCIS